MTPTALLARARSAFPAGLRCGGLKAWRRCRFRSLDRRFRALQSKHGACAEWSVPVPSRCSWKGQTYLTAFWTKIEAPEKGVEYSERLVCEQKSGAQEDFQ